MNLKEKILLVFIIISFAVISCDKDNKPVPTATPIVTPKPVLTPALAPVPVPTVPTVTPTPQSDDIYLLDKALKAIGIERSTFGFTKNDFLQAEYYNRGYLNDEFRLSWFRDIHTNPGRLTYFEKQAVSSLGTVT